MVNVLDAVPQVPFPEDDHLVQALGFNAADKPLGKGIEIRCQRHGLDGLYAAGFKGMFERFGKKRITVVNEILLLPKESAERVGQVPGHLLHPVAIRDFRNPSNLDFTGRLSDDDKDHVPRQAPDETTRYVIRDNDAIFSEAFKHAIKRLGLKDTPTAPRSSWQNPVAERVIWTLRRECLDHVIILNEKHLRSVLGDYIDGYYNVSRTHMSLNKDSPVHQPVQTEGKIVSKPILGGLHHVYTRVA